MIKTYHKTATIKAEQFDGSEEMREKYWILHESKWNDQLGINEGDLYYLTSVRGNIEIRVGDWIIIKGAALPLEVMTDWEFKNSYALDDSSDEPTHRKSST